MDSTSTKNSRAPDMGSYNRQKCCMKSQAELHMLEFTAVHIPLHTRNIPRPHPGHEY